MLTTYVDIARKLSLLLSSYGSALFQGNDKQYSIKVNSGRVKFSNKMGKDTSAERHKSKRQLSRRVTPTQILNIISTGATSR